MSRLHVHRYLWRRRRWRRRVPDGPVRALLDAPPPDFTADYRAHRFLVLDLETLGLERDAHIVATGFLPIERGHVIVSEARRTLVSTPLPMNRSVHVHGLRDSDLRNAAPIRAALTEVLAALHGRTLVVHNAALDVGVLDNACRKVFGGPFIVPVVDTLKLALRRADSDVRRSGQFRLGALREQFGLPRVSAHDALTDAAATAELLLALAGHAAGRAALPAWRLLS